VKVGAVVELVRDELLEVRDGLGRDFGVQLDHDVALHRLEHGDRRPLGTVVVLAVVLFVDLVAGVVVALGAVAAERDARGERRTRRAWGTCVEP
jgi:hypothetical protein